SRQDGHLVAGVGVTVKVSAITFPRNHIQANRGTNGIGQQKAPIASDTEMSIELVLAEVVEAGAGHAARIVTKHSLKEALDKTHRKRPLLNQSIARRTLGMFRVLSSATAPSGPGNPSPQAQPPSRPLDTAPKGAETHPGDGRLSVGNATLRFD